MLFTKFKIITPPVIIPTIPNPIAKIKKLLFSAIFLIL